MTALERAEAIVSEYLLQDQSHRIRDAIHRAIIEHSNAKLRDVMAENRRLREALEENGKPEPDMRHKRAMQESQEYAKALKALEGDDGV